ncbi:hypothetical protein CAL24_08425 [Bordetella genomosp. 2]|uniref:Uncharacterized protein n=1 Tax=Bordetella genomosp. 2 TaxID=1983456 RepID=A0A261W0S6_9BORD|nr:hypothetical protein CAL24_08425 [Bordetella genomosp. 2]
MLPRFVENGLVAAFRPHDDAASLTDLSGNGVTLEVAGSPSFDPLGVLVGPPVGYTLSIAESPSYTKMVAYRIEYELETPAGGIIQIAGSRMGFGAEETGCSLTAGVFAQTPEDPTGTRLQHAARMKLTTGSASNYRGSKLAQPVPAFPFASPWQYAALTFDDQTKTLRIFEPAKEVFFEYLTVPAARSSNPWRIGYSPGAPDSVGPMRARVAEALFYDRALTSEEVSEQFESSVAYLASRGIDVSDVLLP